MDHNHETGRYEYIREESTNSTHYRCLFKNNHAVMLLVDPETGAIVDANPAACSFYGCSREIILEMKISQINILSEEQVFAEMDAARKENRNHFFFRHRLSNGDIREVEVYSGPIYLNQRQLLYSIIHDITEKRKAEEALQRLNCELENEVQKRTRQLIEKNDRLEEEISERKKTEKKLEASLREIQDLYDNAPCGYHSLDKDGTIIRINATELKWLGYTKEEVIGKKKYSDIISGDDIEKYRLNLSMLKEKGSIKDREYKLVRKIGEILPVLLNATAVTDDNGDFIMSRSTICEISELKKAESELKKFNDSLEQLVRERTCQLEESNTALQEEIAERSRVENELANQNHIMTTILENLSSGVTMVEAPSGKAMFSNGYAKKILGRSTLPDAKNEKLAEEFQAFQLGTDKLYPLDKMPLVRGLYGEKSYVNDMAIVQASGKKVILEVYGAPVMDINGKIAASLVSFNDITERRHAEDRIKMLNSKLLEANQLLEATNAELQETVAVSEEEIKEYKKTAEKLKKAKAAAKSASFAGNSLLENIGDELKRKMNAFISGCDYPAQARKTVDSLMAIIDETLYSAKIKED